MVSERRVEISHHDITWLATRHDSQAHAALAGTQFTLAPGPRWWAATAAEEAYVSGAADAAAARRASIAAKFDMEVGL